MCIDRPHGCPSAKPYILHVCRHTQFIYFLLLLTFVFFAFIREGSTAMSIVEYSNIDVYWPNCFCGKVMSSLLSRCSSIRFVFFFHSYVLIVPAYDTRTPLTKWIVIIPNAKRILKHAFVKYRSREKLYICCSCCLLFPVLGLCCCSHFSRCIDNNNNNHQILEKASSCLFIYNYWG